MMAERLMSGWTATLRVAFTVALVVLTVFPHWPGVVVAEADDKDPDNAAADTDARFAALIDSTTTLLRQIQALNSELKAARSENVGLRDQLAQSAVELDAAIEGAPALAAELSEATRLVRLAKVRRGQDSPAELQEEIEAIDKLIEATKARIEKIEAVQAKIEELLPAILEEIGSDAPSVRGLQLSLQRVDDRAALLKSHLDGGLVIRGAAPPTSPTATPTPRALPPRAPAPGPGTTPLQ